MSNNVSQFIHDHLARYANIDQYLGSRQTDGGLECELCQHDSDLYERTSTSGKQIICKSCALFTIALPTNNGKRLTVKQKDTFFIIGSQGTRILGALSPDLFDADSPVKVMDPTVFRQATDKGWRHVLADLIRDRRPDDAPVLVIYQSKADRRSTFTISFSPDFLYLCGHENLRIDVKRLQRAHALLADIPAAEWQSVLRMKNRHDYGELPLVLQRKYEALMANGGPLVDPANDTLWPLPSLASKSISEFSLLGWM